jgi:hypothetical protein
MKALIAVVAVIALGCHSGIQKRQSLTTREYIPLTSDSQLVLGNPIVQGKVAIVPVLSLSDSKIGVKKEFEDYILLNEASVKGWVEITEIPGAATVSELLVRNLGPRTLLLLAGDVLLGGKQDRILAKDTLVPPKESRRVSVFCVEQGRWHGKSMSFESSSPPAPIKVRDAAIYKDQAAVWDSVAESNRELAESPSSTSIRESGNSRLVQSTLDANFDPLLKHLSNDSRLVGAVLLINGRIVSFELFGSNSLFLRGNKPIVRSLLIESASAPEFGGLKIDVEYCAAFVREALKAERNQTAWSPGMAQSKVQSDTVQGIESMVHSGSSESQQLMRGTYSPN